MHFILSEQDRPNRIEHDSSILWRQIFHCCCALPVWMQNFKKSFWRHFAFFPISKLEQWSLVIMNYIWKFQCHVTDNKAYRTVRTSYVNCMHKAEFLWFSCWQCLSSCYYVAETRSPNEANNLKRVRLKSQQSETFSNKQNVKWIASLWNISYCRKNVTFLNWGYLYSSNVCARSTSTFLMKWPVESR